MADSRVKDQGATLNTPQGGSTSQSYGDWLKSQGNTATTATTSVTRTSYDKPDLFRTAAVTNAVYQNLMGRDATPQEIQKYHQEFLKYAASHPSRETVNLSTGGSSTVSSGISEQDYITNLVKGTAEAGQYNAATTYFDAMKSAMNTFSGGF